MSRAPLRIGGEVVAYRVRTRTGAKPIVAHAGWRTSPEPAAELALQACAQARWPEPIREARRMPGSYGAKDSRRADRSCGAPTPAPASACRASALGGRTAAE